MTNEIQRHQAASRLLAMATPAEADQALLTSLQSSLGVGVEFLTENRFPVGGGLRVVILGARLIGEADPDSVRELVEAWSAPASRFEVENWLVGLQVATAGARRSEDGQAVALELYASALQRFPADVAKAACENAALHSKWFPTLAELVEECERNSAKRAAILKASQVGLKRTPVQTIVEELARPTTIRNDKERVRAMAAEVAARCRETTEAHRPKESLRENFGPVDSTGITAEMRAALARQRA